MENVDKNNDEIKMILQSFHEQLLDGPFYMFSFISGNKEMITYAEELNESHPDESFRAWVPHVCLSNNLESIKYYLEKYQFTTSEDIVPSQNAIRYSIEKDYLFNIVSSSKENFEAIKYFGEEIKSSYSLDEIIWALSMTNNVDSLKYFLDQQQEKTKIDGLRRNFFENEDVSLTTPGRWKCMLYLADNYYLE
jgi:hypothetical protein